MPLTEQQRADLAKKRGQASAQITDPQKKKEFIAKQGDAEGKNNLDEKAANKMDREADDTIATGGENIATGVASYKKGTNFVPKTGPANLHKGEEVVPAEKNPHNPQNFSKGQIAEDTERAMSGKPQKYGAGDMSGLGPDEADPDGGMGMNDHDADDMAPAAQGGGDELAQAKAQIATLEKRIQDLEKHTGLHDGKTEEHGMAAADQYDDNGNET